MKDKGLEDLVKVLGNWRVLSSLVFSPMKS